MPSVDFLPVILGTGLNAYNLARSLHEAFGVTSLALGRYPLRETAHSRIVEVRCDPGMEEPNRIVEILQEIAQEYQQERPGIKLLLLPTIEFYTNTVLSARNALSDYLIPLVEQQLAAELMDKTAFFHMCSRLQVPHPETVVVSPSDLSPELGDDLPFPYPVILKPSNTDIYPRIEFEGREKVYLLDDASAVRAIADKIFEAGYPDDLLIQEFLKGDESVMRVANAYSDQSGRLRFLSIGQVLLTEYNPALVGNNNAILSIDDPELGASIRTLLDGIGYVGPANLDIMFDQRTGVSKVLEVNLRPGATAYYTMGAGGNLARCFVDDLVTGMGVAPFTTKAERLWLNLPLPAALWFAPASTRARLWRHRSPRVHTLKYRPDLSLRRRIEIARLDLRRTLDYVKYAKRRLNR